MYSWSKKQEYPVDVASGICVGVMGAAGSDIDRMGFVFLRPIANSKLLNVQYPTLSFETGGITPETLKYLDYTNTTNSNKDWEFIGGTSVTVSSSWSVTTGLTVHAKVSVEAGIPLVAKVTGEFGWQLSASSTWETCSSTTDNLNWKVSGTLQPSESISLRAVTGRGTISVPYSGAIRVTLNSGFVFEYPLRGQYSGVSYSGVTVT